MSKYIIRLDDATQRRDISNWNRMEELLDFYNIKPLIGVIPCCNDKKMEGYDFDQYFWEKVFEWREKDYGIAMHGYEHVYCTSDGGINPVNNKSEFASLTLEQQKDKIAKGVSIMRGHNIDPKVFFAPSHTFDENTILALLEESNIRIISDTVANKPYKKYGITFVPQQSGNVRKLPFNTVTFCYHPNVMTDESFITLEKFIRENRKNFISFPIEDTERKLSIYDKFLRYLYFARRK